MNKLTEDEKKEIRNLYRCGCTQMELAELYDVSQTTICCVVNPKARANKKRISIEWMRKQMKTNKEFRDKRNAYYLKKNHENKKS